MMIQLVLMLLLLHLSPEATCDVDKDKEKCANVLVGVAPCLAYVSGESRRPPIECCTGLKQVLQTSPECMCLLVKDRNDPSLGLKINATLALTLPSQCHAPANVSNCPALLHLAPNSSDAKVFEDFANSGRKKGNSPAHDVGAAGSGAAAKQTNDGGICKDDRWLIMVSGLLLLITFLLCASPLPLA